MFKTDDVIVTRLMPKPNPAIANAQASVELLTLGFRTALIIYKPTPDIRHPEMVSNMVLCIAFHLPASNDPVTIATAIVMKVTAI